MSRFDFVAYFDKESVRLQLEFKNLFCNLEALADRELPASRWKSLLLTNLEYAYMCAGKAIRDDQIMRTEGLPELQEERSDS